MSHSYTRVWIHTVLGTKDHQPTINAHLEGLLHDHIKNHLEADFNCLVRAINGTSDHIHILFLLSPNFAVKDILQNIKGESSHWVNQHDLTKTKFAWQTGYSAFSVSESGVAEVHRYIEDQKHHHTRKTFVEEREDLFHLHRLQFASETVKTVPSEDCGPGSRD